MTLAVEPAVVAPPVERGRPSAARRWRVRRATYLLAAAWYLIFIGGASFTLGGKRAFGLFDDGMISLTYARNLATGHGLVWNAGAPRVEGMTNLGWTLLMAVPELLRVPDRLAPLFVQLAGVAILLGCGAFAGRIATRLAPHRKHAGTVATVLVLAYYPLVYWTLRGMEVGWLTLLLLVLIAMCVGATTLTDRKAANVAACAAALGVLTRLDFGLLVVAIVAWLAWDRRQMRSRRVAWRIAAGTACSVVGQEVFRRLYYGAWVPNTYALKLGKVPMLDRVERGGSVLAYAAVTSVAVLLVLVACAWRAHPSARRGITLVVLVAATASAYEIYVGGDAWEWMRYADRYLAPAVTVLLIPGALGICALAERAVPRSTLRIGLVIAAICSLVTAVGFLPRGRHIFAIDATAVDPTIMAASGVVFVLLTLFLLARRDHSHRVAVAGLTAALLFQVTGPALAVWFRSNPALADFDAGQARAGDFLRRTTPASTTMAVAAAGALVYFGRRDGVDILGKMEADIAAEPVHAQWFFWPGHMKWDYAVTLAHRPDLVVGPWLPFRADLAALHNAGYTFWAIRPGARRALGLHNSDGYTLYVSPSVKWLDPNVFVPRPFPPFDPDFPILRH